jgi:REP element-mobilizing transposase RayT
MNLFGKIVEEKMRLNNIGEMITVTWKQIPDFYKNIQIKQFIVMPNHMHGIIRVGATPCGRPGQAQGPAPTMSLQDVVHRFKSSTTHAYFAGVRNHNWSMVDRRLWQRNYWEHIIRDEKEHYLIEEYITNNPANWEKDTLFK